MEQDTRDVASGICYVGFLTGYWGISAFSLRAKSDGAGHFHSLVHFTHTAFMVVMTLNCLTNYFNDNADYDTRDAAANKLSINLP